MEQKILIILHLLASSIWIGGHLMLVATILPKAWRRRDPAAIKTFEESYEKIGIPALVVQVATGLRLATFYLPMAGWFQFDKRISVLISVKILLLLLTAVLAVHARFFIIPKLTPEKIGFLGLHIIMVTTIAIVFMLVGLSFRLAIF
jgi:putative copper export protein